MSVNTILTNGDRLLAAIYEVSDPIATLQRINSAWTNSSQAKAVVFELNDFQNQEPTRDPGMLGRILRSYRSKYQHDYTADQVQLQMSAIMDQVQRLNPNWKDFLYAFILISEQMLTITDGQIKVNAESLFDWNGYLNKLDANVLIGAFSAAHPNPSSGEYFECDCYPPVDNPGLESQLHSVGFAENHAHLKAAGYITELNWAAFFRLGLTDQALSDFVAMGNLDELSDRHSVRELQHYLRATKYLRILLDSMIPSHEVQYKAHLGGDNAQTRLEQMREELFSATLDRNFEDLNVLSEYQRYYIEINDVTGASGLECINIISAERKFWIENFKHLIHLGASGNQPSNQFFKLCLNLYIVCANHLKMGFVQDNHGNGFDHFTDAENVKSSFYNRVWGSDVVNFESVFEKYTIKPSAKKIELRIAPKNATHDYIKLIDQLQRARDKVAKYHENRDDGLIPPDFGLIIHFIKDNPLKKRGVSRADAYYQSISAWATQAEPLLALMTRSSYQDQAKRIVGIDTANLERENPPELFADVYRRFNRVKQTHNFHSTYHVGESSYTLMDGLRHIYEVIFKLEYTRGDRLGHALALGDDPVKIYQLQRGLVVTTKQSLLDDLVWMYLMYRLDPVPDQDCLTKLTAMFDEQKSWVEDVSGQLVTMQDYLDAYQLRGVKSQYLLKSVYQVDASVTSIDEIHAVPYEKRADILSRLDPLEVNVRDEKVTAALFNVRAVRLHLKYMLYPLYYQIGCESITERMSSDWLDMVVHVQKTLQNLVILKGVYVESNPSSNKKIGYSTYYQDLPMLKLNRHGLAVNHTPDLPLSVNTDDGSIFQTTLAYEYELIAKALIIQGENPETVNDYVKYLQNSSIMQSFVRGRDDRYSHF